MLRLASILFAIIATALAGSAVIATLVLGYDTWQFIVLAASFGTTLAVPATVIITKQILAA